jgi:hypothetical protein
VPAGKHKAVIDILGEVRDERGFPVGRIRQTMELPAEGSATLAGKQVLLSIGRHAPARPFFGEGGGPRERHGHDRVVRGAGDGP